MLSSMLRCLEERSPADPFMGTLGSLRRVACGSPTRKRTFDLKNEEAVAIYIGATYRAGPTTEADCRNKGRR